jgi:DUF1009 family protein
MPRLGIIAGGGALPARLIAACRRDRREFFVLGLKGQADRATLEGVPHAWAPLGATDLSVSIMKENGVDTLVLAGSVKRPGIFDMKPDKRTLALFTRLGVGALGDDRLLRAVAEELEKDGFKIVGAHEVEPALLAPEGLLTARTPNNRNKLDVEYGILVARTLGKLDVGQAAVIQQGIVLGLEAVEGTDALLQRCAGLRRQGPGGVLVKCAKPQQDRRLDLPVIGPRTVRRASEAGLEGIAFEAGSSVLLEREETVKAAEKAGLFLLGFR